MRWDCANRRAWEIGLPGKRTRLLPAPAPRCKRALCYKSPRFRPIFCPMQQPGSMNQCVAAAHSVDNPMDSAGIAETTSKLPKSAASSRSPIPQRDCFPKHSNNLRAGDCSANRPNQTPPPGSSQWILDSVSMSSSLVLDAIRLLRYLNCWPWRVWGETKWPREGARGQVECPRGVSDKKECADVSATSHKVRDKRNHEQHRTPTFLQRALALVNTESPTDVSRK